MIALAWKWFVRLVRQGKHPEEFVSAIATYAARAVKSGRRLCGQETAKDVLSSRAQGRRGFTVSPILDTSNLTGSIFDEALHDNTATPIPDQVCFRIDFPYRFISPSTVLIAKAIMHQITEVEARTFPPGRQRSWSASSNRADLSRTTSGLFAPEAEAKSKPPISAWTPVGPKPEAEP